MNGAIVSNAFLHGDKYSQPADMLCSAAKDMGMVLTGMTNADLTFPLGDSETCRELLGDADFIIFWDKDVPCAENIELCGIPVFNSSGCIRVCDDKALTHLAMIRNGVETIDTVCCPLSFGAYDSEWFIESAEERLGYPMVVKDRFGSFGQQVRLVNGRKSLAEELSGPYKPRILQRYIECGASDLRLEVVGGKVVAAVKRIGPEGDFRSNTTIGGRMEVHEPSPEEVELAIGAASAVDADFAGVDIIIDDGTPTVCEVNSNAHIKNLRNCTGRDVSYDILKHIISQLR